MKEKPGWELTPLRFLHIFLMLLTMWGMLGTCISSHELRHLNAQLAQIQANLGQFGPNDPTKFKLMKLPSINDHELRWRYFQPGNVLTQVRIYPGYATSGWEASESIFEEGEYLYRIKLVKAGEQVILFYTGPNTTGRWQIEDPLAQQLLYDHWDELQFEHAEEGQVQEYNADETFPLIRIVAPLALLRQLGDKQLSEDFQLLWIRVGAEATFEKQSSFNTNRGAP